jgi:hypothetical protein
MDAMILSTKANKDVQNRLTQDFIVQLKNNYPQFSFREGRHEHWSPTTKTITYNLNQPAQQLYFGLLHELAHALLGHLTYKIEDDHVQNCLDTYRDWLHRRSSCPQCGAHVLQRDVSTYQCFNCQTRWHVSSGRFVRPYRKMLKI